MTAALVQTPALADPGVGRMTLVLCALLGLCSLISVQIVGAVFLLDGACLAIGLWALATGRVARLPATARLLLALLLLWLAGAVATDLIRGAAPSDYLRGWGRIVMLAFALITLCVISGGRLSRVAAFLVGFATAGALQTLLFPSLYQTIDPWKFGFAIPAAISGAVAASVPVMGRFPSVWRQAGVLLVLALLNLAFNFRSMFVVLLAAALVVVLAHAARRLFAGRRVVTPLVAAGLLAVFVAGGAGVVAGYSSLVESGALGQAARAKHMAQSRGDLGLLLGGRSEALVSVRAIAQSPVVGHGSWARDRQLALLRTVLLRRHWYEANEPGRGADLIPSHSHLLGAWVEAGVAGGLFWGACLVLAIAAFLRLIDLRTVAAPLAAFSLALLIWNILFSPFGAEMRFLGAAQLAILVWVIEAGRWRTMAPAGAPP